MGTLVLLAIIMFFIAGIANKKSKDKLEKTQNILTAIKASQTTSISISVVAKMCNLDTSYVIKILTESISIANRLPTNKRDDSTDRENLRFLRNANINMNIMIISLDPNAMEIRTKLGDFLGSVYNAIGKHNQQPAQSQAITYNINQSQNTVYTVNPPTPSFCAFCGSKLQPNADSCRNCGSTVTK